MRGGRATTLVPASVLAACVPAAHHSSPVPSGFRLSSPDAHRL
jgi:hypothetical protein